jgi:hypothetical protein
LVILDRQTVSCLDERHGEFKITQLPNYPLTKSTGLPTYQMPRLARISEEMKQWSSLLEAELSTWPGVTSRPMFGMMALYRKGTIFAALPRTRCFNTPRSVAFKLHRKSPQTLKLLNSDSRIARPFREDGHWITLELQDEKDLADALKWFDRAYQGAGLSGSGSRAGK